MQVEKMIMTLWLIGEQDSENPRNPQLIDVDLRRFGWVLKEAGNDYTIFKSSVIKLSVVPPLIAFCSSFVTIVTFCRATILSDIIKKIEVEK